MAPAAGWWWNSLILSARARVYNCWSLMGSKPARVGGSGGAVAARGDPFRAGGVVEKIGLLIWLSACCCCGKFGDFILPTGDKFSGLVGDDS